MSDVYCTEEEGVTKDGGKVDNPCQPRSHYVLKGKRTGTTDRGYQKVA